MTAAQSRPCEAGRQLGTLELAIEEFLEEGFAYTINKRELEETPASDRPAAIREWIPRRRQVEGYFAWLRYLLWLDSVRDVAPTLPLLPVEAQGLLALHRARNRFQRTHPPCLHCGMPNDEFAFSCHQCHKELKR